MVKALNQLDVLAEIVTTNDHGSDLLDVPLNQLVDYQEAPVYFFSRFSPPIHSIREFAYSGSLTSWLWKNIHDYDLLHIHAIFSYPSTIAMVIARHHRIPYIVRPLGQLCTWSLQQSARKKQAYLQLIERENLYRSSALHFTSVQEQNEAEILELDCPSFILPHGITIPPTLNDIQQQQAHQSLRQQLQLPSDEPILLFLSRLHAKKGLDYLLPALGQLKGQRFTFLLAGSGELAYEAEISQLIKAAGLDGRVHRLGLVAGEMKQLLLKGSDLFVLTSYSENFGVAVLEAIAAGLPVVVTFGVALAEVVKEESVGFVAELEVESIATAIRQGLANPTKRREMSARARALARRDYAWDSIAQRLCQIYKRILNQPTLSSYSKVESKDIVAS